jgi:hypothetical protein
LNRFWFKKCNPYPKKGSLKKAVTHIRFLPIIGIVAFICLYLIAAHLYPGGSLIDRSSEGFDWSNNYWCNLYYTYAINGELNPSRKFAILGMCILCVSLLFFFFEFPLFFSLGKVWRKIIPFSGLSSMLCAVFIYTDYHDILSVLACSFGSLSLTGMFIGLKKRKMKNFVRTGIFCVVLIALNAYIYFSQESIFILPILQKVTFAAVLLWIALVNSKFGMRQFEKIYAKG